MKREKYTPEHLNLWERPSNYAGAEWHGYYSAGVGQSRDSSALERANFDGMRKALGILDGDRANVTVVREGHWAVGWVEWIAIRADQYTALRIADEIREGLEDYPVVDEELWSEYEHEDCAQTWDACYNERERLDYLKSHCSRPSLTFRETREAVRGDWHAAANLLPCPSDLIA